MVLKFGIDQIPRAQWTWTPYNENWISADHVNPGEPDGDHVIYKDNGEKKFNYGFNDFVVAECTPELAYEVKGQLEREADLPPKHPRAAAERTKLSGAPLSDIFTGTVFQKHKSGYRTTAYGWGDHADVLDANCETNHYIDIEGPKPAEAYGDVFVKFVPLLIPGGLAKSNTFWIDLNKGLRALYFPARYIYHPDAPGDAGYAKISFVENSSRNLIDAKNLIFENTSSKSLANTPIDLEGITRKTAETIQLNKSFHVGAYSFDSTLIVNVPKFIAASYYVAGGAPSVENPHDALYLAKSVDIKATLLPKPPNYNWRVPPSVYTWEHHTKPLMRTYSQEVGRMDQISLQEVSSSDLGAGEEFFLNVLVMAGSLIPYVGPLIAVLGVEGIEALKGLRTDSSAEEAEAAGISAKIWNGIPGEAKEQLVPKLGEAATKVLKYVRRK